MMFRTLAFIAFSTATVTGAGTARAAGQTRGTLTCEQQSPIFRLELNPPRYVQTTEIDLASFTDELMRPFQEPGEEHLSVRDSSLHIALNPGSCTVDTQSRAHFLECPTATDDKVGFQMSNLHFTADGTSPLGSTQSVTINRNLRLLNVSVHADVQTKKRSHGNEERIIAVITVNAAIGAQSRTLHLTKDLGEWTAKQDRSNYDRCVVTP